ncbi:MAG TPA: IPT/TIG domain-containing protein [Vicinamibacterales bacterium]|nr:IPT/TIG domain-containing protein [Vicinamibacterales bacterium]
MPTITSVIPPRVVEGGRVALTGSDLSTEVVPSVVVGNEPARTLFASSSKIVIDLPEDIEGGPTPVRIASVPGETIYLSVGAVWATGLHQVDNPVFDPAGNLFVTYSGSRGQESPVSVFRVTPEGSREPFVSGIVNATSLAIGPDGHLYVSSRFEGAVYRVKADGSHEQVAADLGVACGLTFDDDGSMYVGDRSGTIFRVREGKATAFATLPASVAAFHLAMSEDGELFVSGPTLGTYDHIHRINRDGEVRTVPTPFGRPQGLAFSPDGALHVIDALAGASGLYRFASLDSEPELIVSGGSLIGVAFGPNGELVVASNESVYRFE